MRLRFASVMLLVFVFVSEAYGAPLFSQPPSSTGMLYSSSWWAPASSDYDEYVWDRFVLSSSQSISTIAWWGGYSGAWGPAVDFNVEIYPSIAGGGQPDVVGGPLVSYTVGNNAGETLVGNVAGRALFRYEFTLPQAFAAQAGTPYWLRIFAWQNNLPDWGIFDGAGGDSSHFRRTGGTHQYFTVPGDTALELSDATPVNHPPVASAGPDQSVAVGALVTLDGSASSDADGDALAFGWSWLSKPAGSAAALSGPSAVKPTFIADVAGSYVIRLVVDDGVASSIPDSVTVTALSPGEPPYIAGIYANPPTIWPHNKKMVSVALTVNASDSAGHAPVCGIVAVGANESIPSSDWRITGRLTVDLRADGAKRVYAITVRCTDAGGLYSTKNVEVPIRKPLKK